MYEKEETKSKKEEKQKEEKNQVNIFYLCSFLIKSVFRGKSLGQKPQQPNKIPSSSNIPQNLENPGKEVCFS